MARGKNEVTLTLAGDSDQLERAIKRTSSSTEQLEKAFEGVQQQAKQMDTSLSMVRDRTTALDKAIGKGGADFRAYRSDLDGVGDGFNDVEDRAMGAGNLINGFNDVLRGGDPATFAMGLSDMAAGIRYTVVPTLQDTGKGVRGMLDRMKASGGATGALRRNLGSMIGVATGVGVAAAVAAVAWNDYQNTQEEAKKRTEELTEAIKEQADGTRGAVDEAIRAEVAQGDVGKALKDAKVNWDLLTEGIKEQPRVFEELDNSMKAILEGKPVADVFRDAGIESSALTEELVRLIDESDATAGVKAQLIETLDGEADRFQDASDQADLNAEAMANLTAENEKAVEKVNDMVSALDEQRDAMLRIADPLFGMTDALDDNRRAQDEVLQAERDLATARRDHGASSTEAKDAEYALIDAQRAAVDSAGGVNEAMVILNDAVQKNPGLLNDAKAKMDLWVQQGLITEDQANQMKGAFDRAAGSAAWLGAQDPHIKITTEGFWAAVDAASRLKTGLDQIPREVVVNIRAQGDANRFAASRLLASGGVVEPIYAAAGTIARGPRGTDTVPAWLTPGEMVLNKGQQANLWAMANGRGGGGVNVNLYVAGSIRSDKDIVKILRDEITRGGLAGVR